MRTSTAVSGGQTATGPGGARRRAVRLAGLVSGICLVAVAATAWTLASRSSDRVQEQAIESKVPVSWQRSVVGRDGLEQRLGIRLVRVAVTGDGGLMDLRFQVLDPDAAADLHDEATPPAIVDEGSGVVANDLLMGHSHNSAYTAGLTYYLIFENPGNIIRRGSRVSVLLGDTQVPHVLVK